MVDTREIDRMAGLLGVSIDQIRRDHLISHVLAAIEANAPEARFFGGTALNRTLLVNRRLSEDIDLMTPGQSVDLELIIGRRLLSSFGSTRLVEGPRHRWMRTIGLETDGGITVRVQFVEFQKADDRWGWAHRPVRLNYSDLPDHATMVVPDDAGFVAMKLAAYLDRHAPRDLYDLAGLADAGAITPGALSRYREATGAVTTSLDYVRLHPTTEIAWHPELAHQTANLPSPSDTLAVVRSAIASALTPPPTAD